MLELDNVHVRYGRNPVLHGVSLRVSQGEVAALLGRNGMGKSTAVHAIIGFVPPHTGVIRLRDQTISGLAAHQIARRGVAIAPQGRRIFPSLTVHENLSMAARAGPRQGSWTLDKVYEWFPRLQERAANKGSQLSGGEQQMLTIGRALMTNPNVLLMDEPSEGLSPLLVKEIGRIIQQLKADGLSIFLVEQNLSLALAVADTIYILHKGVIVHQCTPATLRQDEETKARYLGVGT